MASNAVSTNFTATLMNMAASNWIAGATARTNDHALWFDGNDDFVQVLSATNLPSETVSQSVYSISALVWFDPATRARNYPTVFSDCEQSGSGPGYFLRCDYYPTNIESYRLTFSFKPVGAAGVPETYSARLEGWSTACSGRWSHVVGVYSGLTRRLYVDGSLVSEVTHTNAFTPYQRQRLQIGRNGVWNETNSYWKGKIDDVRMYYAALDGRQVADLYDALGDLDGDGTNNLQEYLLGANPTNTGAAAYTRDGALDVTFVPTNWTVSSLPRYLAHFDDANAGTEIHLWVDRYDQLEFIIYDAQGRRHSIRHPALVSSNAVVNGQTNRIVASWKNLNTAASNAYLRLFVNGLDRQLTLVGNTNPRRTRYDWRESLNGYVEAQDTRLDFPAALPAGAPVRQSAYVSGFPAQADVAVTVHTTAYGIVATDYAGLPFDFAADKAPPPAARDFKRPQGIAQSITMTYIKNPDALALAQTNWDILVHQFAQTFDGAQLTTPVSGWPNRDNVRINNQRILTAAAKYDFDIALAIWGDFEYDLTSDPARCPVLSRHLALDSNRMVTVTERPRWVTPAIQSIDLADRAVVSNYMRELARDVACYTNYAYAFFDEPSLPGWSSTNLPGSYARNPVFSTNGLAWFREYVTNKYGSAGYPNLRFPVCPLNMGVFTNTGVTNLAIAPSATNLLEVTADPDIWAKWWEWQNVVFANAMHGYAEMLYGLNSNNPCWKGMIYFISTLAPWDQAKCVDMGLLSGIPHLDWMVMENYRSSGFGMTADQREQEVQLQLHDLKDRLTNGIGFGNYALLHTFQFPDTNGTFTYSLAYMTQDLACTLSPEFDSSLVVPYSAPLLVDIPGYTSRWQRETYVPAAAAAWNTIRFRDADQRVDPAGLRHRRPAGLVGERLRPQPVGQRQHERPGP